MPSIVGKREWKEGAARTLLSDLSTVSDEAFAILCWENIRQGVKNDIKKGEENQTGKERKKQKIVDHGTKYTGDGASTAKNNSWKKEVVQKR